MFHSVFNFLILFAFNQKKTIRSERMVLVNFMLYTYPFRQLQIIMTVTKIDMMFCAFIAPQIFLHFFCYSKKKITFL